jgi:hypothetical protein
MREPQLTTRRTPSIGTPGALRATQVAQCFAPRTESRSRTGRRNQRPHAPALGAALRTRLRRALVLGTEASEVIGAVCTYSSPDTRLDSPAQCIPSERQDESHREQRSRDASHQHVCQHERCHATESKGEKQEDTRRDEDRRDDPLHERECRHQMPERADPRRHIPLPESEPRIGWIVASMHARHVCCRLETTAARGGGEERDPRPAPAQLFDGNADEEAHHDHLDQRTPNSAVDKERVARLGKHGGPELDNYREQHVAPTVGSEHLQRRSNRSQSKLPPQPSRSRRAALFDPALAPLRIAAIKPTELFAPKLDDVEKVRKVDSMCAAQFFRSLTLSGAGCDSAFTAASIAAMASSSLSACALLTSALSRL